MFSRLKRIYFWYLGRKPIDPILIENRDNFVAFLESGGQRVEKKSHINFGFPSYLSEGIFFYEYRNDILLKHDIKIFKSTWYFHGKIIDSSSGSILNGTYKTFPVLEMMSSFILMAVLFGSSMLVYMSFLERSISMSDVAIVLIGFPLFLLVVRFMMAPMASVGSRSNFCINKLIEEYRGKG